METFFDIVFFPITALVWLISHWQLVLLVVGAIFLWLIFYPMYRNHKINTELEEKQIRIVQEARESGLKNKRSDTDALDEEDERLPEGYQAFDFKSYISKFYFENKALSISDEFIKKMDKITEAREDRKDFSYPDAELFRDVYKNSSEDNPITSPTNAKIFLGAKSRLVRVWATQALMKGYFFGGKGYYQDYGKSYEYSKEIEHISSDATYCVGYMYLYGYFLEKNYQKAFEYLICSAMSGDAEAHDLLGDIYKDGLGLPIDNSLAFAFYNIACSLRPKKDNWREKREAFMKSISIDDLNKGQMLTSMIVDSKYHKLFDIGVLPPV